MTRNRALLTLGLCAMLLVALTSGCSTAAPSGPARVRSTRPVPDQGPQLQAAKAAAMPVLARIQACEAAVIAGPTLDDLSKKASRAQESAQAFAASGYGRLAPKAASALSLAAQDYVLSCRVWRADEKAAVAFWNANGPASGKKSLDEVREMGRHESVWAQGGLDLGKARAAVRDIAP
jgi:hypothetical protein